MCDRGGGHRSRLGPTPPNGLCRFMTALKGGDTSPSLCTPGGIECVDRVLEHFVTEPGAVHSRQDHGGRHSRREQNAVGSGTAARRLFGHAARTGVHPSCSDRPQSSAGPLGQSLVWQRVAVDTGFPRPEFSLSTETGAGLRTKFPWWRLQPGNLVVTATVKAGQGSFTASFPQSGHGPTASSRPSSPSPRKAVGVSRRQPKQSTPGLRDLGAKNLLRVDLITGPNRPGWT